VSAFWQWIAGFLASSPESRRRRERQRLSMAIRRGSSPETHLAGHEKRSKTASLSHLTTTSGTAEPYTALRLLERGVPSDTLFSSAKRIERMLDFLETIENSSFPTWVRETPTIFGYSTVLALHTFGMAFLVGLSGVVALRVLGVFRDLPLKPLEKFFPLIIIGFWVNALTGIVLASLAARSLAVNWDFYIKLVAIAFAIVGLRKLKGFAFDTPWDGAEPPPGAKTWARLMLLFWGIAILAGRLTAYTNSVRRQTTVAVVIAVVTLGAVRWIILKIIAAMSSRSHAARGPLGATRATTPLHP
jgi:hypothetical protein